MFHMRCIYNVKNGNYYWARSYVLEINGNVLYTYVLFLPNFNRRAIAIIFINHYIIKPLFFLNRMSKARFSFFTHLVFGFVFLLYLLFVGNRCFSILPHHIKIIISERIYVYLSLIFLFFSNFMYLLLI